MIRKIIFWGTAIIIAVLAIVGFVREYPHDHPKPVAANSSKANSVTDPSELTQTATPPAPVAPAQWASPLGDPKVRVTKKTFGLYITPQNSPVKPEKFTGYHTGWDFETTTAEANIDVTITAFCAGSLKVKEWATGYGGVAVEACNINGQDITVIYGHLNITSVTSSVGSQLVIGQKIGLLGQGYSQQTDGERKHLHFGIHKGLTTNILGYVQNQADLVGWVDPATYLGSL